MPADIPVVLLGYGAGGEVFHAPLISATAGLRLDAVVTTNAQRAERARERYGVAVLPGVEEVAARRPGLVVVSTPNASHVPLARHALRHGWPVVVDKPLAPTADQARALVAEAGSAGVLLSVFHNRRWDGDFRTVRRLVAEGRLGQVRRFESRFERWRPAAKPMWRETSAEQAGGILLDLGSHLVDQALELFGPVHRVYAELDARRPPHAVEDDAFLALTHAGGVRSALWMSAVAPLHGPRLRVLGSAAGYERHGLDGQEEALRAGASPADPDWGVEPAAAWGRLGTEGAVELVPTEPGAYGAYYAGIVAALRTGAPSPVDPADAVAVAAVLDAARQAAAAGTAVELPGARPDPGGPERMAQAGTSRPGEPT